MEEATVDGRVAALERSLTQQRWISGALLVLSLGLGGAALQRGGALDQRVRALEHPPTPASPETASLQSLAVSRLSLVDARGGVRATLGVDAGGEAALELMAPDGSARVHLAGGTTLASLSLQDEGGVTRAALGWQAGEATDNRASVVLRDRGGAPRADLHVAEGGPRLTLSNEVGVDFFGVP